MQVDVDEGHLDAVAEQMLGLRGLRAEGVTWRASSALVAFDDLIWFATRP